jgi:adenosylcobyric acid synthase
VVEVISMPALMIQGTTSSAGKSLITAAFARWFARRGVDVAPFKAQNMSNNARVVDGGEIGAAQYLQALAAGVTPDVRMNPVLLKPESDTSSQVVVNGIVDHALSRQPWRGRAATLWPIAERALRSLQRDFDLVLIEGAGSPAEINLSDSDIVNMHVAEAAGAPVLLVADIDRGGAFAHLYGTWALVDDAARAHIKGFILNKFRGDPALLAPAPELLRDRTGVATIGVVPWLHHGLPDEDGAGHEAPRRAHDGRPVVAIVLYPTASNLDEYRLLEQVADVVWARAPDQLRDASIVVLPGSKHVAADLSWLRQTGLADAIGARARAGRRILGVCGGLQMLGQQIDATAGIDGSGPGLGLLPLVTTFHSDKRTAPVTAQIGAIRGAWRDLSGCSFRGYEIRHGRSTAVAAIDEVISAGLGYAQGPVLAVYVHGLLESPDVLQRLFGATPPRTLDAVFDELADAVDEHVDMSYVAGLVGR